MAREWVIHDYTGYKGLVLQSYEPTHPKPGQIRLRIEAFALNWGDMNLMQDQYSFSFQHFPARIGMEATGIVDEIGEGGTGIELGRRNCTLPHFYFNNGASADFISIDARYVTPAPKGFSAIESASVWMQFMTAYYPIVELSKAAPGKQILVTAATGTAGNAALNIGSMFGANMIATTRFEYNRDYLLKSGASHVIVPQKDEFAEKVLYLTDGHGIDAAFDPIGGSMMAYYGPALARDAKIFFYGTLDGMFSELPLVDMFQANATFHPYSLFNYVEDPIMQAKGTKFVHKALANKKLLPSIDRVYPMEDYRDAWEYLRSPRVKHGKVVIETGL